MELTGGTARRSPELSYRHRVRDGIEPDEPLLSVADSFGEGRRDAQAGGAQPIDTLWDDIDAS
jgi:hypothetical protein